MLLFTPLPGIVMWICTLIMGLAMAGIGMSVMHDANHGSFSKNPNVNKTLGKLADILGVSSVNWVIQHNKLHHTFTNIYEHDEDVDGKGLFRFSPDAPLKKFHRFQHLYWLFFYNFLSLAWFLADFKAYVGYKKAKLNRVTGSKATVEFITLLSFKLFYVFYMLVIPYLVMDIPFWQIFIGFLTIQCTAGFILAVIFQLAHVVDKFDISHHHEKAETYSEWAVHQIKNTFNFATKNRILTWYCGGLNFQIEHHLFPNISHAHYPKLYRIIKEVSVRHGVNYQEFESFREALKSHLIFLKKLGQPQMALS
jgi:linoleoyl-CoA desaturase